MKTVHKAVAVVVRTRDAILELLVFQHPLAGIQIPKGTVEPGETIEAATLRELHEESGIRLNDPPKSIGTCELVVSDAPQAAGQLERHVWNISVLDAPTGLPETWRHDAEGSDAEIGLTFSYFWVPIDKTLLAQVHPSFRQAASVIVDHFAH